MLMYVEEKLEKVPRGAQILLTSPITMYVLVHDIDLQDNGGIRQNHWTIKLGHCVTKTHYLFKDI